MANLTPFNVFGIASCMPGASVFYKVGWIAKVAIEAVSEGGAGGFFND